MHPGDLVLADRNGVVFVAAADVDAVLDLAERITAREDAMAEAVRAGQPVAEVMHDTRFPTTDEVSPMTDSALDALAAFSCATVSDALDRIGVEGALHGIAPLFDGARLAGRAFTVRYVNAAAPAGHRRGLPRRRRARPGRRARQRRAHRLRPCGATSSPPMAHARGVGGTVIDGVCRDVARALDVELPDLQPGPVHAHRQGPGGGLRRRAPGVDRRAVRWRPATCCSATPTAWCGCRSRWRSRSSRSAGPIAAREEKIVADVLGGSSIAAARSRHGYHTLQRRDDASGEGS